MEARATAAGARRAQRSRPPAGVIRLIKNVVAQRQANGQGGSRWRRQASDPGTAEPLLANG